MMKSKEKELLKNSGITLIALVTTIIIILILSGITIATLNGDNGLIKNSGNAKEQTEISEEKEIVEMALVQAMGKNKYGNITKEGLQEKINEYAKNNNPIQVLIDGDDLAVHFTSSDRYYRVNNDGDVTKIEVKKDSNPGNIKIGINGESLDGLSDDMAFEIWCIEDLIEWSQNYNTYKSSFIKLCQDLDFKSELSYTDAQSKSYGDINTDEKTETIIEEMQTGIGFTPISNYSSIFDGQNNEIKNIYINTEKQCGFVSSLNGGTIKNLKVSGQITHTKSYTANSACGGIVGCIGSGSEVINCINNAKLKGNCFLGGIVGRSNDGKIEKCINLAEIESVNGNMGIGTGGIIGGTWGTSTIINCCNTGIIKSKSMNAAAGICGCTYSSIEINNCYNTGDILCTANSIYCLPGGILGYIQNSAANANIEITNCYNTGYLSGRWGKGSIIAQIRIATPKVNNCFYLDSGPAQTSIATPYSKEYMQSEAFVKKLNDYIKENDDEIDTIGYSKWVFKENSYPTLELDTV